MDYRIFFQWHLKENNMDKYILNRVEIELSVDKQTGEPIIKIRHQDKSEELAQILLGILVKGGKERGLQINNPSGYAEIGGDSHEDYIISLKPKQI